MIIISLVIRRRDVFGVTFFTFGLVFIKFDILVKYVVHFLTNRMSLVLKYEAY